MNHSQRFAAELFPQHTKTGGVAAVIKAADDLAARLGDRDEAILRELDAIDTQDQWEDS